MTMASLTLHPPMALLQSDGLGHGLEKNMQRTVIVVAMLLLALALAACGDDPPPTQIVIVISPTPSDGPATIPASETSSPEPMAVVLTSTPDESPDSAPSPASTRAPADTPLPLVTGTLRPAGFPTDVIAPVPIAEQVFEHGRMFWIRDTQEIWVMQAADDDPNRGDWFCYNDTFTDGEAEVDPNLIPPEGTFQPRRGFGKLWRDHSDIRDGLGWALTPEFELTSNYRYVHGGTISDGEYIAGPGEHRLSTLYNENISFFEGDIRGDCQGGTWRKGS